MSQEQSSIFDMARQYLQFRKGREGLQKNEDVMKKSIMASLTDEGSPDDKGNRFYYFPESLDDIQGVKRERRVSQVMDEDAALELVAKYGLESSCLETITVLNEDGLLAANFEGKIPDSEMAALYTERESFAFILVKDK